MDFDLSDEQGMLRDVTREVLADTYDVETLLKVYGHHHPDHLSDAVEKITAKPKKSASTATASPQKRGVQAQTNVTKIK